MLTKMIIKLNGRFGGKKYCTCVVGLEQWKVGRTMPNLKKQVAKEELRNMEINTERYSEELKVVISEKRGVGEVRECSFL